MATVVKTVSFHSMAAYDAWLELYRPYVTIVSTSGPDMEFSYVASERLPRPKIEVVYLEFPTDVQT